MWQIIGDSPSKLKMTMHYTKSKCAGICQSFTHQWLPMGNSPKFFSAKHLCCTVQLVSKLATVRYYTCRLLILATTNYMHVAMQHINQQVHYYSYIMCIYSSTLDMAVILAFNSLSKQSMWYHLPHAPSHNTIVEPLSGQQQQQ